MHMNPQYASGWTGMGAQHHLSIVYARKPLAHAVVLDALNLSVNQPAAGMGSIQLCSINREPFCHHVPIYVIV